MRTELSHHHREALQVRQVRQARQARADISLDMPGGIQVGIEGILDRQCILIPYGIYGI